MPECRSAAMSSASAPRHSRSRVRALFPRRNIRHQVSGIGIRHQASGIMETMAIARTLILLVGLVHGSALMAVAQLPEPDSGVLGATTTVPPVPCVAAGRARRSARARHLRTHHRHGAGRHHAGGADPQPRSDTGRVQGDARRVHRAAHRRADDSRRPSDAGYAPARPREGRGRVQGAAARTRRRVGTRIELRPFQRRAPTDADPRDACVRRPSRPDVPSAAVRCADDPRRRVHRPATAEGLVGGCDGAAPVHAVELPQVRGRLRRGRAQGHLVVPGRRLRLDRQLPRDQRVGVRADMGT